MYFEEEITLSSNETKRLDKHQRRRGAALRRVAPVTLWFSLGNSVEPRVFTMREDLTQSSK